MDQIANSAVSHKLFYMHGILGIGGGGQLLSTVYLAVRYLKL